MVAKKPRVKEKVNSHTDHGKLGNPSPVQTPEFESKKFQPTAPTFGKLAKGSFQLKLPEDVDTYLRSLPQGDRVALMRGAVVREARERMQAENL